MSVVSPTNPVARSFLDTFVYFWTYFTHLTNLWLLVCYVAVITEWRWLSLFRRPSMLASAAAFIALVMLFYHFMLAPYIRMEGALLVATYMLHYVAPLMYLAWWVFGVPHGRLGWGRLPLILLPGIALHRLGAAARRGGERVSLRHPRCRQERLWRRGHRRAHPAGCRRHFRCHTDRRRQAAGGGEGEADNGREAGCNDRRICDRIGSPAAAVRPDHRQPAGRRRQPRRRAGVLLLVLHHPQQPDGGGDLPVRPRRAGAGWAGGASPGCAA